MFPIGWHVLLCVGRPLAFDLVCLDGLTIALRSTAAAAVISLSTSVSEQQFTTRSASIFHSTLLWVPESQQLSSTGIMASEHRTSALPSKGFAVVEEKQRQPVDTAQASLPITSESCVGYRHPYITGLYGILAVQSFVWTYLQTFVPAVVSSETSGPAYQVVIRDIFSVLFWNSSFIYNFFIILSMRNAAISFLDKPNGQTFSATIIHRIFRMVIIVCAGSGMATLIYSQIGVGYIDEFKTELPNDSIETPMKTYNGLSAVNSLFNFFWLTSDFYTQAANNFWPTGTLWVSSVIYYEVSFCRLEMCPH